MTSLVPQNFFKNVCMKDRMDVVSIDDVLIFRNYLKEHKLKLDEVLSRIPKSGFSTRPNMLQSLLLQPNKNITIYRKSYLR